MEIKRNRIKMLREERQLKQSTVAEALHVSRSALSTYENGITPTMDTCIEIARYYDVSLDYLLGLSHEKKPQGGMLFEALEELGKVAGDAVLTSADLLSFIKTATLYYRQGATAKHVPLSCTKAFLSAMTKLMNAASADDTAAMIIACNEAARAGIDATSALGGVLGIEQPDVNT